MPCFFAFFPLLGYYVFSGALFLSFSGFTLFYLFGLERQEEGELVPHSDAWLCGRLPNGGKILAYKSKEGPAT